MKLVQLEIALQIKIMHYMINFEKKTRGSLKVTGNFIAKKKSMRGFKKTIEPR